MDIYEQIIDILKKEYAAGATYQELADKYGVSSPTSGTIFFAFFPEKFGEKAFFVLFVYVKLYGKFAA